MRSFINAILNVVVNGRHDRTNVGIGLLRGSALRLRSRLSAACAQPAYAYAAGMQHPMPAHPRAHVVESGTSATIAAPCWCPEQVLMGLLAFACTT